MIIQSTPNANSTDPVWFMQCVAPSDLIDASGMFVAEGQEYLEAHWLKQHGESKKTLKFQNKNEAVFFMKESVGYPFLNFSLVKKFNLILIEKYDFYDKFHDFN